MLTHKNHRLTLKSGHIEYDVPAAPAGTPPEEAVHVLTTRFTTRELLNLYGHPGCDPRTEYYCADENIVAKRFV